MNGGARQPAGAEAGPDSDFAGHFEALAAGSICFPYCTRCERYHWYPMARCPFCHGLWCWRPAAGPSRLLSWTVVHRHFSAREDLELPYAVALIVFEDAPGVRLVSAIAGEPTTLRQMMRLEPVIHDGYGVGRPTLTFRPFRGPDGTSV